MILIIVKNFLSLLLTLCSSQGSAYCHQKLVMQNACLRLYSCFQQNTTKIPMKIYSSPFQSNKKAQVSLSDVTELFPN